MGWAVVDVAVGNAVAVALDSGMLQVADGQKLVDIPDDVASNVLSGVLPLHSVFGRPTAAVRVPTPVEPMPAPVAPAPVAPVQRRQRSYTTRYPAMLTDEDVDALASLARTIPERATAVEIGSRLGGSAKIILENSPSMKRMYCIDSEWQLPGTVGLDDPGISATVDRWKARDHGSCFAFAKSYLSPHTCARLLAKASPSDVSWWSEPVDFVFEDSSHANPQLTENIWFWWKHLRSGGILSGHDYGSDRYPDVTSAVNAFSEAVGVPFSVTSNIWHMAKP